MERDDQSGDYRGNARDIKWDSRGAEELPMVMAFGRQEAIGIAEGWCGGQRYVQRGRRQG